MGVVSLFNVNSNNLLSSERLSATSLRISFAVVNIYTPPYFSMVIVTFIATFYETVIETILLFRIKLD